MPGRNLNQVFFLLFLLFIVLFILILINILGMAFRKLGFPPEYSVYFLFMSLLGSYVNLPLNKKMLYVYVMPSKVINFHSYAVSSFKVVRSTPIAINLGGAVIPVIISVFLSTKVSMINVLIGILIMTILIHKIARPVKGSGMAIHVLFPPFMACCNSSYNLSSECSHNCLYLRNIWMPYRG